DQPSLGVGPGPSPGTGSVWVDWEQGGSINVTGALVTGLGQIGGFGPVELSPGTSGSFGDIAIGPSGQVLITYQSDSQPSDIFVNLDADGLGPGGFGPQITVTTTHVDQFYPIPADATNTIDAEANLAWDLSGGPHTGRVYMVYTNSPSASSADT